MPMIPMSPMLSPTTAMPVTLPTMSAAPTVPDASGGAAALLLAVPVVVPLLIGAAHALPRSRRAAAGRRTTSGWAVSGWAGLLSPLAILVSGALLARTVLADGPVTGVGGLLRADALTAWMLLVVGAVGLLACAAGPPYLAAERAAGHATDRTARRYHLLIHAFLGTMSAALLAANLGVLWAAIEATTIVTAFLVGHRRTRVSVEAAWKYVVICSAGIALAFLGIVLIYYAARDAGIPESSALDWRTLLAHADRLDPDVTRLGIALVVLGFGAKAGLVPLHAWLPDAHSQAPAPVSALMSGVLLAVSFTALLRCKAIADAALGTGFARALLIAIALLTLAVATALLLGQRDYKRMLAYSTMEHMALIALGAAIGTPLALAAVLLHIAGHGLAKTVAFLASGHILHLERTTRIDGVRGLLARSPGLGTAFGLAVAALLGLPPFSLFASELGIARAGFTAGLGWPTALALVLVLVAYAALAARTARMLFGAATVAEPGERDAAAGAPAAGHDAGAAAPAEPGDLALAGSRAGAPAGAATVPASGAAALSGVASGPGTHPADGPPASDGRSATEGTPSPDTPAAPAGSPPGPPSARTTPARLGPAAGPALAAGLVACAALGVATGPLTELLNTAAAILGGH